MQLNSVFGFFNNKCVGRTQVFPTMFVFHHRCDGRVLLSPESRCLACVCVSGLWSVVWLSPVRVESVGRGRPSPPVCDLLSFCSFPVCVLWVVCVGFGLGVEGVHRADHLDLSSPCWPPPSLGSSGSSSALRSALEAPRSARRCPVRWSQTGLTASPRTKPRRRGGRGCGNVWVCPRVWGSISLSGRRRRRPAGRPALAPNPPALP